jgi:two-component sensor histidine kinase
MSHLAAYRPGVARLPSSGELELVVRVSNYEYRAGGMWRPFVLGPASALERASWVRQTILCAESAALGALALSYLFFFLNRRRERTYLYFALLLLSISLRALVTGEYVLVRMFPGLGFDALIRLEYVSVFFPTPLAALFFSSLFPLELSRKGVAAIVAPFFVLSLLLPAAPLRLLTRSVLAVYPLMALAMLALGAFVFVPAVARRREDSVLEFVGASLLMALGVNDALFASFKVQTGNFFPFGLLIFVGIQSHVLSRRFSAALESAVELSAEKDSLIKEVHHRVKNSLQIISSAIALQSHRAEDPAVLRALEATRARVRAISLVHERLYALDAPDSLDLGDYVRDLARQLEAGFRRDRGGDELVVEAEAVPAPQGLCVDVGLALAELLSNAYRHAARRGEDPRPSRVSVSLRGEGDAILLRVADDGPGFPEGFSPDSSRGLGFRMISSLARRRGWSLTIGDGPGAVVELRIPRRAGGSIAGQAKERG